MVKKKTAPAKRQTKRVIVKYSPIEYKDIMKTVKDLDYTYVTTFVHDTVVAFVERHKHEKQESPAKDATKKLAVKAKPPMMILNRQQSNDVAHTLANVINASPFSDGETLRVVFTIAAVVIDNMLTHASETYGTTTGTEKLIRAAFYDFECQMSDLISEEMETMQ
jgi:hypothetical protein